MSSNRRGSLPFVQFQHPSRSCTIDSCKRLKMNDKTISTTANQLCTHRWREKKEKERKTTPKTPASTHPHTHITCTCNVFHAQLRQYERNICNSGRLVGVQQVPGRDAADAEVGDQRTPVRDTDRPSHRHVRHAS